MVVLWPAKNVQINLVCPNIIGERINELILFNGCTVDRVVTKTNNDLLEHDACVFSGITGTPAHMSSLMKALEDAQWDAPEKVYIFISSRKKNGGKKHGQKTGTEIPAGCEGGNPEGADRAAGYGEAPGVDGDRGPSGDTSVPGPEGVPETPAAADSGDQ